MDICGHFRVVYPCFFLMAFTRILVISLCCFFSSSAYNFEIPLDNEISQIDDHTQTLAARAVARRVLGENVSFFNITVDGTIAPYDKDTFQITKDFTEDLVHVIGSSGVAACWGLHHYLKHYCNCHISWDGDQLAIPHPLPNISITVSAVDKYRYYQNVVTTSYSFVWWKWSRWQREIDWMALNGINLALAFTGQEAVWQRVYLRLNLTQTEINDHFCGPAFLSWCRMGNIIGWGGPLPQTWQEHTLQLQHHILNSMRELGITPVLPGFAGHVPKAFIRLFPNASMRRIDTWNHFLDRYCCPYLLEPIDPLFNQVGQMFMTELIAEFGTNHIYNCDTFNEMLPRTGNLTYLRSVGEAIFKAMTDVDPIAIWLLQGWLFYSDTSFWLPERAEALLTSVPTGRMIVLDLQSEQNPQYSRLHSYFGQPFIWCMLHNFGGTLGLFGSVDNINKGILDARNMNGSTMIGIGLTPEGINQNYVVYDLVLDMLWRSEPVNLTSWISAFAKRRYGAYSSSVDTAWQLLKGGVYNFTGLRRVRGKYIICRRPTLNLQPWYWYNTTELHVAWEHFINSSLAIGGSQLFQHDLVDVSRQALQVLADALYIRVKRAFQRKNFSAVLSSSDEFLQLLQDMDDLLSTNKGFLLGTWLKDARQAAASDLEQRIFEFNARNQITLWGPLGEIKDYATKQWSGVVSSYYLPRWQLFFQYLKIALIEDIPFDSSAFIADVFSLVEEPFTTDTSDFPDIPQGNSVRMAVALFQRWGRHSAWTDLQEFEDLLQNEVPYDVDDPFLSPTF